MRYRPFPGRMACEASADSFLSLCTCAGLEALGGDTSLWDRIRRWRRRLCLHGCYPKQGSDSQAFARALTDCIAETEWNAEYAVVQSPRPGGAVLQQAVVFFGETESPESLARAEECVLKALPIRLHQFSYVRVTRRIHRSV